MKNEILNPIESYDYEGYHIRLYIVGSSIDVIIYDENKNKICKLYDFKTIDEAKDSAEYCIDEEDF